jgi:UPF0755 protein
MKPALSTFLLFLAAIILGARFSVHLVLERTAGDFPVPTEFTVKPGQGFGEIARSLKHHGLIRSSRPLILWARWQDLDRRIHPGSYLFEKPLSPLAILARFRSGSIQWVRVTIPEGLRASEIIPLLVGAGMGTAEEYAALLKDPDFLNSLFLPIPNIEGYLYPDTYFFAPETNARKAIFSLTTRFHEVFNDDLRGNAAEAGFTAHEVVTLASVVEKETGQAEERPLIASVFLNRLKIGMPLQSDPTVIYGIEKFDGNLTRKHLRTPTPFNTYTNRGLPPGPIASPGLKALLAVLEPAESDFLYFVSRNDGTHQFSRNLADHNRAVNRFQRARAHR